LPAINRYLAASGAWARAVDIDRRRPRAGAAASVDAVIRGRSTPTQTDRVLAVDGSASGSVGPESVDGCAAAVDGRPGHRVSRRRRRRRGGGRGRRPARSGGGGGSRRQRRLDGVRAGGGGRCVGRVGVGATGAQLGEALRRVLGQSNASGGERAARRRWTRR